jgi:NADH-quinone oxidoreductase subunit N
MTADPLLLMPIIIPSAASVALFLISAFAPSRGLALAVSLASLAAGAYSLNAWSDATTLFSGMIQVDEFSRIGGIFCFVISAFAVLAASSYFRRMDMDFGQEYYALVMAATAGMVVMVAANDLMVLFVNLELISIATYILCGMNRQSMKSTESAIK